MKQMQAIRIRVIIVPASPGLWKVDNLVGCYGFLRAATTSERAYRIMMRHMVSYFQTSVQCYANMCTGLLDHTWSGYRGNSSLTALEKVIKATYTVYGQ